MIHTYLTFSSESSKRGVTYMKPITAIKLATILSVFLTAYFVYEAATKGIQSISLQDWLSFLLDIGIGVVIVGAALIKIHQERVNK
jgi:hypothetical protein